MADLSAKLHVVAVGCTLLLSIGWIFGYNALKPSLVAAGVYADRCEHGLAPCEAQSHALDWILEFATASANGTFFFVGLARDVFGALGSGTFSAVLRFGGILALALSLSGNMQVTIPYWYALAGIFGSVFYLSAMGLGEVYPKMAPTIAATFTVAWDLSSGMPIILNAIRAAGVPFRDVMIGFGAITSTLMFIFSLRLPSLPNKEGLTFSRRVLREVKVAPVRFYFTPLVVSTCLYTGAIVTFQAMYMSSLQGQMKYAGGDHADKLVTVFNYLLPGLGLPLSVIFSLFNGWAAKDRSRLPTRFLLAGVLHTLFLCLSLVRSGPAQYVVIVVFISWRIYSFIAIYNSVFEAFEGFNVFGRLCGIASTVGGCIAFSAHALNDVTTNHLDGDPRLINVVLGGLVILMSLLQMVAFGPRAVKHARATLRPSDDTGDNEEEASLLAQEPTVADPTINN